MPDSASSPEIDLVKRLLTAPHSLDEYVSFFAEDAAYRFANYPPMKGQNAIREAATRFRQRVQRAAHDIKALWQQGAQVTCELEITYTRLDGKTVSIPGCDVFIIKNNKIQEMRVYVDVTPVFA